MDEKINIAGALRRPDGIAMANNTITVTSVSNSINLLDCVTGSKKTDEPGCYEFNLLPGGYTVSAAYPDSRFKQLGSFNLEEGSPAGTLVEYLNSRCEEVPAAFRGKRQRNTVPLSAVTGGKFLMFNPNNGGLG